MKLKELFLNETAAPTSTSVSDIGDVEYRAFSNNIKLFKRNECNDEVCIANIKRKTGDGWRFVTNNNWDKMGLPHFGQLTNIKSPVNGKKTISTNLEGMLKQWGVNYKQLVSKE